MGLPCWGPFMCWWAVPLLRAEPEWGSPGPFAGPKNLAVLITGINEVKAGDAVT
jgi:hypothetical protein